VICVDASIAAKWIFAEDHSDQALALASACARESRRMMAPVLLPFEVTNVIRKRAIREALTGTEADLAYSRFLAYGVTLTISEDLHRSALTVAQAYNLPAVYDAYYIALAQALDCSLWTDDRRLLRAVGGPLPFVRWIGDYTDGQPL